MMRSSAPSMSTRTAGSAFSLMVTPAVGCGTETTQMPSLTPVAATAFMTSRVMSLKSLRAEVFTLNDCMCYSSAVIPHHLSSIIYFLRHHQDFLCYSYSSRRVPEGEVVNVVSPARHAQHF